MCAIDPSPKRVGETATCRHRSVDAAEGAAVVAFGRRGDGVDGYHSSGLPPQPRHVPSGEARYSRPVELDASLGCPVGAQG